MSVFLPEKNERIDFYSLLYFNTGPNCEDLNFNEAQSNLRGQVFWQTVEVLENLIYLFKIKLFRLKVKWVPKGRIKKSKSTKDTQAQRKSWKRSVKSKKKEKKRNLWKKRNINETNRSSRRIFSSNKLVQKKTKITISM